jgi:hypothetical protein
MTEFRTIEQIRADMDECNRRISDCSHWGAAFAALDEWRRDLRREMAKLSLVVSVTSLGLASHAPEHDNLRRLTMTDENQADRKSILAQIQAESQKARRDAIKQSVKAKYADLVKAEKVVADIKNAIVDDLLAAGEDEAGIRAILSGE